MTLSRHDLSQLNIDQPPVMITGMHNSGTSILAEIIHTGGIFLGPSMDHFESAFFSIFMNDKLLLGGNRKWAELPLLPVDELLIYEKDVAGFIKTHWIADFLRHGYDGRSRWGFKDPRLCVLLPLYLQIFPQATVVHIKRNVDDVAASLSQKPKRGVGQLDEIAHWKKLTNAYTDRVAQFAPQCHRFYELEYETLCTNPKQVVEKLFQFLDLPISADVEQVLTKVTTSPIGSYDRLKNKSPLKKAMTKAGRSVKKRLRS